MPGWMKPTKVKASDGEPMPGTEVSSARMSRYSKMADKNARNTKRPLNNSPWPMMSGLGDPKPESQGKRYSKKAIGRGN